MLPQVLLMVVTAGALRAAMGLCVEGARCSLYSQCC